METKLPRGYRNNNPLNIRINPHNQWKGKVIPSKDKAFEQFVGMEYGYRAALSLLRTYIRKYGCNTVAKIITRWAPENENNTQAYIHSVCKFADLTPDLAVKTTDRDTLTKMAYAMSIVENGSVPGYPDMEIINKGWDLL